MNDIEHAKQILLAQSRHTCVFCKGNQIYTSDHRGVYALVYYLSQGTKFTGFAAADRVVGKAAALLLIMAGVREVYAQVMSESALYILSYYGTFCSCAEIVPEILDYTKSKLCPLEASVANIKQPEEAYRILQKVLDNL